MASRSVHERVANVSDRVHPQIVRSNSDATPQFNANYSSVMTAAPGVEKIQQIKVIYDSSLAKSISHSTINVHNPPTSSPTALLLELLRSCEESSSQPMLIMCQNEDPNPNGSGLMKSSEACATADEDDETAEHNNNQHHPNGAASVKNAFVPPTTACANDDSAQSIRPIIGPIPFLNPVLMIRIVDSRRPVDVLIGKSQTSKMHVGNVAFRAFVNSRLDLYKRCTRRGYRIGVCVAITNAVFAAGGRFYVPLDQKCRKWEEADTEVARVKVGNSIRDSLKKSELGTKTIDVHTFSASTSFGDIVDFFLDEMKCVDQVSGTLATIIPQRLPPIVIHANGHEENTYLQATLTPTPIPRTRTQARVHHSTSTPILCHGPKIYSFVPRHGTMVATLVKRSATTTTSSKKRKRDSVLPAQEISGTRLR